MGAVAKSYMRKGFLIYGELRKYLVTYEEAVSHIWPVPSGFPLYMRKIMFSFLSVWRGEFCLDLGPGAPVWPHVRKNVTEPSGGHCTVRPQGGVKRPPTRSGSGSTAGLSQAAAATAAGGALIKKKIKFSSDIRKFRMDQLQSHIWLTDSSYRVKYLRISSYIGNPFLIYDFSTAPFWISWHMRKIWFSFLSVRDRTWSDPQRADQWPHRVNGQPFKRPQHHC